jgi:hypothetical protein
MNRQRMIRLLEVRIHQCAQEIAYAPALVKASISERKQIQGGSHHRFASSMQRRQPFPVTIGLTLRNMTGFTTVVVQRDLSRLSFQLNYPCSRLVYDLGNANLSSVDGRSDERRHLDLRLYA